MFINRQPELALSILVACARRKRVTSTTRIAAETGISKMHAAQVSKLLAREGWIRTHRGLNGGIELAMPAEGIRLGDVLYRTHPSFVRNARAKTGGDHRVVIDDRFERILDGAIGRFVDAMNEYSVEDLGRSGQGVVAGMGDAGADLPAMPA